MSTVSVVILGAGTMGTNIALDLARAGYRPQVVEVDADQRNRSREYARAGARFMHSNGLTDVHGEKLAERVTYAESPEQALPTAEWVIEVVPEDLAVKQRVLAEAEKLASPTATISSNTSSILPSKLAAALKHPERFLATHFWNPAHLLPLVEVVPHAGTKQEVIDRVVKLLADAGKHPILLKREIAGFLGNRLAFARQREAMARVARGVAPPEDIDAVAALGFGRRMPISGIFGTADLGGLDVYRAICDELFPGLCADRAAPAKLRELVEQGKLGVKSGAGWRIYSTAEIEKLQQTLSEELVRHAQRDQADQTRAAAAQHTMILDSRSDASLRRMKQGQG
ncbi:MAG: butyryl-CoA dehydrogenase [Planctomycetota bacterium]